MDRLGILVVTLLATLAAAPPARAADAVPGEIIVRFKGDAGGSERAAARRAARVSLKETLRSGGTQLVATEQGQGTRDALAALRRDPRVKHAIPNRIYQATATPDDPRFAELWGLHQVDSTVPDPADIDAPEAWEIFNSAPDTVVAVVDTGVRTDHPDLAENLWANDDTPGSGDQDRNGLVDDIRGYDFVDNDNDVNDLDGHGTHVAGTIAAQGNNEVGITGVAWDAQIMPVRVLDENGSGTGVAIDKGFRYAAEEGARVVNASLGGPGDAADKAYYDDLFDDYPGTLFVLAAGNSGTDNDTDGTYPCNSSAPNVVCVAATDDKDALAGFSNFGQTTVDLAAPGVGILSSVPRWSNVGLADDFATGLDGWSVTGNTTNGAQNLWGTFTDSWYGGGTNSFLSEKPAGGDYSFSLSEEMTAGPANPYDLAGQRGCVAAWHHFYEYDEGRDHLFAQTSPASPLSWTTRQNYTGTNESVEERKLYLKADGSSVRMRFRTVADGTLGPKSSYYGSMIDNFRVQCTQPPDETSYAFLRGTSMAAPHVAGVATLLFGARSDANVADVRGWLLSTGDPLPSTADAAKLVTGRRLNAHKALLAAGVDTPAITGGVVDVKPTSATLLGTVTPAGTETTYRFLYGRPGTLDSTTTSVSAGSGTGAVAVNAPITGLNPETTYEYRLVVTRGGAETAGSDQSFTTPATTPELPPALTINPATGVGDTVATVGGSVDPNGKPATVLLEYGRASGSYTSATPALDVSTPSEVSAELTGLTPGTTYFYRLRAGNADGEATSSELSFTTTGTAPPAAAIVPPGATTQEPRPPAVTAPPAPPHSVICKLTKRRKVACRAGSTAAGKVGIRILRAGRLVARGSANGLTKGRALRIRTLRRVRRGRHKLQLTIVRGGVKTTLTKTIRL